MTAFLQHSLLLHIVKLFLTFAHGNAVMIHCDWLMYEKLPEWFVFLRVQMPLYNLVVHCHTSDQSQILNRYVT